jgi:hypothetical protein
MSCIDLSVMHVIPNIPIIQIAYQHNSQERMFDLHGVFPMPPERLLSIIQYFYLL